MKSLLKLSLVLLLLYATRVQSQNYNAVIPLQQQFFELDSPLYYNGTSSWSQVKVMYFDSSLITSNGISRFSFYTVRDTDMLGASFLPCLDVNAPAWMGYEMQEQNNGMNILFNYNKDSIRIQTLATVNDNWHFYDSINGAYINAHLDSIVWMQMGGIQDSVKCISLLAYDSLGAIKSNDPLNGTTILLSKANGFYRTVAFREFPLWGVYFLNRIAPIALPTIAQMNDFNVNDEFESSGSCSSFGSSHPPAFDYSKILTKTISYIPDTTVTYTILYAHLALTFNPNPTPHLDSTLITGIDTVVYSYSNNLFFTTLPEENRYPSDSSTLLNYSISLDTLSGIAPVYFVGTGNIFHQPGDSCYSTNHFEPVFGGTYYSPGFGVIKSFWNETSQAGPYCEGSIFWFHKGSTVFGNYISLFTGIDNPSDRNFQFQLYPNPNSGSFTIQYSQLLSSAANIEITNTLGEIVYTDELQIQENKKELNVSFLNAGLYFLQIITNNKVTKRKFIIN